MLSQRQRTTAVNTTRPFAIRPSSCAELMTTIEGGSRTLRARIADTRRHASASRQEVADLALKMAGRLQEIMEQMNQFTELSADPHLSMMQDQIKGWLSGSVEPLKSVPLIGLGVSAIDKLRETDAAIKESVRATRILGEGKRQMNEIRAAHLAMGRWKDISDYAFEVLEALENVEQRC